MNWNLLTSIYLSDPERRYVLVSLVEKKGSSYLQPGARMLVREDGRRWGNISAGCLEGHVTEVALDCLRTGENHLMPIDTRPHYGCFGEITLLLEVLQDAQALFQSIETARIQRQPITVHTQFDDLTATPLTQIHTVHCGGLSDTIEPQHRVVILGDWPDGRALSNQARLMGWDIKIYDASAPQFETATIVDELQPDAKTAVVVMTHSLSRDVACLKAILPHPFGYVGVIGSRKRRRALEEEILALGDFNAIEQLEKVHCPAGLDIGGDGPEAIALSVLAEIQASFAKRNGTELRLRTHPIHSER